MKVVNITHEFGIGCADDRKRIKRYRCASLRLAHPMFYIRYTFKFTFLFFAMLTSSIGHAEDSLSALMQKIKSESAVKIAYQEIRTLELMDQPWHGSGYMYSMSPDIMIREQLLPQRVLMGIKGDKMFYFEPADDVRHQGEMDENDSLSLNFAVFKALINADEILLRKMYLVELSTEPQRWVMSLKPKQDGESGFSIVVSGLLDQQVDTIRIRQADGDLSEFMLQKDSAGDEIKASIDQLYQELRGE